ncbi:MAG: YggS family pyridoxal phosphate-dependent enzyme [Chloroflexi bacterium]|nr:YggS family pyridoxal phosphate-dependent enzyme [Chloroflexota bacterium]
MTQATASPPIEANIARVRARIAVAAQRAGRDPVEITLVAVTKGVSQEAIQQALAAGITDFGENLVQEAQEKFGGRKLPIRLHMVGHLQRNKAKTAVGLFHIIHSVDSVGLAALLSRHAALRGVILPILLQVNVASEPTKSGFQPRHLFSAMDRILHLPNLEVTGLMTLAPIVSRAEDARGVFQALRRYRDDCLRRFQRDMLHLSMGMTDDFEVAVEEGATIVRIGRAIFAAA